MMKMEPPMIYLPEDAVESVEEILKAFHRLDRGPHAGELRRAAAGDEIELSREQW